MITEEKLQAYEHDADEMQGRQPCGYLPDDIRELVTEVRRLNAAYARMKTILARICNEDGDPDDYYVEEITRLFEPESEDE